jgi:predicted dehydrogenase
MSHTIAIIGAGTVAREHTRAATHNGLKIAGICDIKPHRAIRLAEQYESSAVRTVDKLLAIPNLSLVVVATPNRWHCEHALAALNAGHNVLLEKPMAVSVEQCDAILDAQRTTGRTLHVNLLTRQAVKAQMAKRLIDAGRLGDIYHVKASWYRRRGIPGLGGWFTTRHESGGGVAIDLGVHLIDLARWLVGKPTPVRASAHVTSHFGAPIADYRYTEMWAGPPKLEGTFDVDDGIVALVRFDNGVTLELNITWAVNLPEGLYADGISVLGTEAGISFEPWGERFVLAGQQDDLITDTFPHVAPGNAWVEAWNAQYAAIAASIANDRGPVVSAEDARTVQAVIEALYASSEAGQEVEIH